MSSEKYHKTKIKQLEFEQDTSKFIINFVSVIASLGLVLFIFSVSQENISDYLATLSFLILVVASFYLYYFSRDYLNFKNQIQEEYKKLFKKIK